MNEKFSQELRFSAPLGSRVEGMLGVFYTHENHTREPNWGIAENPATGVSPGVWFISKPYLAKYEERAVFANLTVQVTDRFDIQLGGRQGRNSLHVEDNGSGVFQGYPSGTTYVLRKWDSADDAFTYSVSPRFKPSPDLMVYARLASGYRSGGPTYVPQGLGLPDQYGPDKTLNYEVGVKGDLLDRVISFDASLYYIDWKDIQTSIFDSRFLLPYIQNVGMAKSQGVDLSVDFRPRPGLTVTAWGAWNDAVFTKDFVLGGPSVAAGDRLPNSPRWSGRVEAEQKFPLSDSFTGVVGGSVTYTGDRIGPFFSFGSPDPTREVLPSFVQTDVHAGVQHDAWTVNFFVTNVTDKRSVYAGGHGGFFGENHFLYSQPRTMGLSLSRTF